MPVRDDFRSWGTAARHSASMKSVICEKSRFSQRNIEPSERVLGCIVQLTCSKGRQQSRQLRRSWLIATAGTLPYGSRPTQQIYEDIRCFLHGVAGYVTTVNWPVGCGDI